MLKVCDIIQGSLCDIFQNILSKKGLMPGDNHVWKGEQASKDVILNNPIGQILKEQVGLFLVDIQRESADFAGFESLNCRFGVDQCPAAGVDQHDAVLHLLQSMNVDKMVRFRRQRTVQSNDIGSAKKFGQRNIFSPKLLAFWIRLKIVGQ